MKAYLRIFINLKQNNWEKLLPMAEFAYNNTKNARTDHTLFKLNYGYYPKVLFEEDINFHLKSYSADKLVEELKELIEVGCQNLFYAQKLQKKVHSKVVKSYNFTPSKKV